MTWLYIAVKTYNIRRKIVKFLTPNLYLAATRCQLRPSMVFAVQRLETKLVGVEIGVQDGINALSMLENMPIKKLYLIDPYIPYQGIRSSSDTQKEQTAHFQTAKKNLAQFEDKIQFITKKSEDATNEVPNSLDFVYVDGNHNYSYVKKDIELYYPKLKIGGLMSGHDYAFDFPGVKQAVDEFCLKHGITILTKERDWFFLKKKV